MSENITNLHGLTVRGGKHRTLGDYAHEHLLRLIIGGDYPISRKLPSEARLSESIGVSRPIIRQALAMLRDNGIIASRQGSGSYVIRRPHHSVLSTSTDGSLIDTLRCYEFRITLESAAAALAAQRHNSHELAAINEALEELTTAAEAGKYDAAADNRFHTAVCRAAGNKYFESALAAAHDHLIGSMELGIRLLRFHRSDGWKQFVIDGHGKIAEAIADRDATRAAECARRHIEDSRDAVLADTESVPAEVIAQIKFAADDR